MFFTRSEDETIAVGRAFARTLPARAVVLLTGNLGAGKTTFTKGVTAELCGVEDVSSPTFSLIHEYGHPARVYHIDLYRLDEPREVATLGLDEIFDRDAVVLIEWGERFPQLMPTERFEVHFEYDDEDEGARRITVTRPPSPHTSQQSLP